MLNNLLESIEDNCHSLIGAEVRYNDAIATIEAVMKRIDATGEIWYLDIRFKSNVKFVKRVLASQVTILSLRA